MGLRKYIRLLAVPLVALLLLSFGTVAAGAPDKSPRGEEPGDGAVTVLSNGIYKVSILNDMSGDPGIFTVGTGSEHPVPEADMLYGGWEEYPATSYLSVWDYGSGVVYTSDSEFSSVEPAGSYAIAYMGAWGVEFESSRRQATTRWFPEGHIEVEQEVEVIGSSLSNSAVRVTTKVSNTSDHRREVGIRYFWDIMVADEDGVWYATRDPGSSFGQSERIYTRPTFDRFVATDYPDGPELLVFGSMKGPKGVFSPNPTPPARFIFGSYSNHDYVWDYPEGQDPSSDSAVLYYWGWDDGNSPIELPVGGSVTATVFLYAVPPGYPEPGQVEDEEVAPGKPERERPPEPAKMSTNYLLIDPQQVLPGQEVRVSANVCNSGEEKGALTASLAVNGVAEQAQSVSVSGGSCKAVVFAVSKAVPGTYQVAINGMTGQFSVLAPRTVQASVPSNQATGLGTAGIAAIAAIGVVLIAGLILVFRR